MDMLEKGKMKSKFTGSSFGFMGVCLAAGALATVTLGIGLPWAVCMILRWQIGHTVIDGKRLQFDGKGGRFFGLCLLLALPMLLISGLMIYTQFYVQDVAMASLLAVVASFLSFFYSFWVYVREMKWIVKNVHFEKSMPSMMDDDMMMNPMNMDFDM